MPGSRSNIGIPHAGSVPIRKNGAYGTSKAAVTFMAKVMALEEAKHEVRVNVVSPGAILTEMLRDIFHRESGSNLE